MRDREAFLGIPWTGSSQPFTPFLPQKSPGLCMLLLSPDEETGYTKAKSWTKVLQLVSEDSGNRIFEADPELSAQISRVRIYLCAE